MEKADKVVRCIFVGTIFEFVILQVFIGALLFMNIEDFTYAVKPAFIINCVVCICFLVYNILIFLSYSIFRFDFSKKLALYSIIFSILFTAMSLLLFEIMKI